MGSVGKNIPCYDPEFSDKGTFCPFRPKSQLRQQGNEYRKIPKIISPGAYIFQRPFLRGLFLEALLFGGDYLRREICVSKSIGIAL